MTLSHRYSCTIGWNAGERGATSGYENYSRNHLLEVAGKPALALSSDPAFRGDPARHNPEELLLAALASCHMLWYLHLAASNGIEVLDYRDEAEGVMMMSSDGGGQFSKVTLHPHILIAAGSDATTAHRLHGEASRLCFIARSVNFPVQHRPVVVIAQ